MIKQLKKTKRRRCKLLVRIKLGPCGPSAACLQTVDKSIGMIYNITSFGENICV
jgi:hypothetical protein